MVLLAVVALGLFAASPALATDINDSQVPTTAQDAPQGDEEDCADFTKEGMVLWHFILNGAPSGETPTITATFDTDGDLATTGDQVNLTDVGDEASTSGTYHFFIETPDDYVLVWASTDVDGNNLVLSHVCIGPPTPPIPEAPIGLFLPLVAIGAFGVFMYRNRRQATLGA